MSDKQVPISENEEQPLSVRNQQLISYLEDLWKRPHKPSPERLKRITELLTQFPEPYRVLGMTKIAEYLANSLSLHFLDIIATFVQKAEDEKISREEQVETLRGIMPERFPEMMGISKQILIRSLDDLVTLGNITFSLFTLSQVDSAEQAQGWMYELPVLYWRQLTQERLITNMQVQLTVTKNPTTWRFSGSASWNSSLPNPVEISPATHELPTIA